MATNQAMDSIFTSAADAFAPPPAPSLDDSDHDSHSDSRHHPARHEACSFLKDVLRDGPLPTKDILKLARDNGLGRNSLRSAKEDLKISVVKRGVGKDGSWYWRLPGQDLSLKFDPS